MYYSTPFGDTKDGQQRPLVGPAPTVDPMKDPHAVDPGDAALQELLTSVAEHIHDPAKKASVTDFLLTMKPLAEWPQPELDVLTETCAYVISLARMSRELDKLNGAAP